MNGGVQIVGDRENLENLISGGPNYAGRGKFEIHL